MGSVMRFVYNDREISIEEVKILLQDLEVCPHDGGTYEYLEIDDVEEDTIYLSIGSASTF